MHKFILHTLVKVLDCLRTLETASRQPWANGSGNMPVTPFDVAAHVQPIITIVRRECEFLDLNAAREKIDNQLRVRLRDGISYDQLEQDARALRETIDNDLPLRRFAYVPDHKARLSDKISADWENVWNKIPEAKLDIQESVDCYALDRNTACVYHLMRVAEWGLRSLAARLRVKITHSRRTVPIEFGDWDKVITAIKNKIASARSLPTGPKRQAKLEFYSDAADHCLFMKEIWRNNIAHTRQPYTEEQALAVMGRVRDFMKFIANS